MRGAWPHAHALSLTDLDSSTFVASATNLSSDVPSWLKVLRVLHFVIITRPLTRCLGDTYMIDWVTNSTCYDRVHEYEFWSQWHVCHDSICVLVLRSHN